MYASRQKNNYIELRRLVESFVDDFLLQNNSDGYIHDIIMQKIYAQYRPLSFLENVSKQQDTLGDGILQYVKKLNNRYNE